jgi:hypothetical protein
MGKTLRDSEDVLLKKITVANYRQDPYYARIVKAVEGLLREKGFVAPLELFIRLDLLSPEAVENRRRGRIAHLERAMRCNLADDVKLPAASGNLSGNLADSPEYTRLLQQPRGDSTADVTYH